MKKKISIKTIALLLLVAFIVTLCACAATNSDDESSASGNASGEATEATEATKSIADILAEKTSIDNIDETKPVGGVYQIHTKEGFLSISEHPDASFTILCDIDMEGAEFTPFGTEDEPFTGRIDGGYFVISNMKITEPTEDGYMGFVGVNAGTISNLTFENLEITATADTKAVGALAGYNKGGQILRNTVSSGTLDVSKAAEDSYAGQIAGISDGGKMQDDDVTIDLLHSADVRAFVGGFTGATANTAYDFTTAAGKLVVTGGEKVVGMLTGRATADTYNGCAFSGLENTVDGVLYETIIAEDNGATRTECAFVDNDKPVIPENIAEKRQLVVDMMVEMCSVKWKVKQNLRHSCTCSLSSCHGIYNANVQYIGLPYNHKWGGLYRAYYTIDEDGYLKDWMYDMQEYDGFDMYLGNDCSGAVNRCWAAVSDSICSMGAKTELPIITNNYYTGTVAVGDWAINGTRPCTWKYTGDIVDYLGEQAVYETYACGRYGDAIAYTNESGGHTRMMVEDPVVVRYEDGTIDPMRSYIVMAEQGHTSIDIPNEMYSSCERDKVYTFAALIIDDALPTTIPEFVTGEFPEATAELQDHVDGLRGISGAISGNVHSSLLLDHVIMTITDEAGNEVFNKTMFTKVKMHHPENETVGLNRNEEIRAWVFDYDLSGFANPLTEENCLETGKTYTCKIVAGLADEVDYDVATYSFTM